MPPVSTAPVGPPIQRADAELDRRLFSDYGGPAPDWYDNYTALVAPHFSPTPALIPINAVYTKYGNWHQSQRWRSMSIQARAEAQRIYRMYNLTYTSRYRCGLFIAGDESEVSNKYRDRMMVLVFELKADEIHKWRDIHFDAVQLLDRLELSGDQDVCIRYYERPSRDGDGPPNYLTVSDQDHGAGDQSGTVPRTDHYQRYLAEQNRNQQYAWYIAEQNQAVQAYEHAESLQQRAQWERQQRAAGNHDTTEHISIAEAARALTSIARLEEERAQRNAPPPYSQHSGLDPSHEGPALNGQLHEIIDFYNALANPSRRDRPGEEMYEPDSGTDLSDQSVAGSDKEDGQPFLRRPEMPPPAIEMR